MDKQDFGEQELYLYLEGKEYKIKTFFPVVLWILFGLSIAVIIVFFILALTSLSFPYMLIRHLPQYPQKQFY